MSGLVAQAYAKQGLTPGQEIGRYLVLGTLGKGGMGVVVAAYDPELARRIALKVLHPSVNRERLLREAQALARLNHPNVVSVHDMGPFGEGAFITMEFINGPTLATWLRTPRSQPQIIEAFVAAARGLAAAHAVGIVHRDFKPTNVMLADDGRVRLTDFGLAHSGEASPTLEVPGGAPLKLTRTGAVMGTPAYMAPEQFCGHTDHRSDQFALCVALWEALCGQRPYAGQHLDELRKNVTAGARSPVPVDVRLPIWVRRALERGLANDPEDRFPEMEALIAALEADPRPRRRRIVAAGLAVGLVTAAVAWQQLDRRAATQACHDGGARIHTVLTQATRTTIKAAFTATGVPFAQSSFERAMGHMETWAATWEQQHVNTCLSKVRAELPREHAGLQYSCLEDQLARYAGLVDLFGDADTDVVRTAIDATTRLPEPQMCARPEVLATAVSRADSAQAPKIRRELARVEGLLSAERGADAKAAAQQLYTQATELELTELIHRATLDLGLALIEVGEHEEGHERLREAYFQSLAAGNDLDALDAAVALIDANSRIHPRYEQAHGWAKTAEALVSRLGRKGSALQARVLHALGNLATHEKSARHGAELYQRAYELRVATLPSGHPDIASSILSLGNVALDRENVSEAFDHYTKNLEMLRANLGAMHPHTARALSNLGNLELRRVRYEAAIARYREAFSVLEPLGPENYEATVVLQNLGAALYHSGEHREALATWEQALALRKLQLAPSNPDIGELSANIAAVHSSLGDHEQALAALLETRESFVLSLGAKHSRVARVHNNIASILVRLHRYDEARPHAEKSLTLHIHNSGEDSEPTARSRTLLAQILLELGEFAQARQQLERALAFLRLEPGDQLMEWSAKFRLAQLDWHAGHRKRARAQLDVLREARGRKNADDVDTWLAEHDP